MNILLYVGTLVLLPLIDSVWLLSTGALYKKWLAPLFAPTVNFVPVIFFYLIYAFGVAYFVIAPALRGGRSLSHTLLAGALFGLVAYATYDLTNNATLRDWPLRVTFMDMAWGAVLTGLVSVIMLAVLRHFQ